MARVLVIGGGQLGTELMRAIWPRGLEPEQLTRVRLDLGDRAAVLAQVRDCAAVINAAAYTAVDKAEAEAEQAARVNRDGPAWLAEACAACGAALLHVSTDYVFDGSKSGAYTEDDPVVPLGVYGRSKEEGEQAIRARLPRHAIIRTAWVFAAHGHNFVKTMLRLAAERDELRVVADQRGCPTAAADLAQALIEMARQMVAEGRTDAFGTYHFAGDGPTTWHGFAEAIITAQAARSGRHPNVIPIATADYPTPARRPANSVLDCGKIGRVFGIRPRPWRETLGEVLEELRATA